MQKNNLCPLSNKILLYEELDSFSQSTFNPNKLFIGSTKKSIKQIKQKYIQNISSKINPLLKINNDIINKNSKKKYYQNNMNNNNSNNKLKIILKNLYTIIKNKKKNYINTFKLNYYIFSIDYLINKYRIYEKKNKNNEYIMNFYYYNDSIKIIPKKEYYFRHHMIFLERPNFKNVFYNRIIKRISIEKLAIYQINKKKENKIEQLNINNDNKKFFNTNILETIENYSTTITQSSNHEKHQTLTPFEIFKRCEDTNKKKKDSRKKQEQKSITTFSESEISYKSKNIIDESLIAVVKDLSEKPNKFKDTKNEKKYTNYFIKKKDIQKFKKNIKNSNISNTNKANLINRNNNFNPHQHNKNNNNNIINSNSKTNNNICNKINNNNDDKELSNKKSISSSTNKKIKKRVIDNVYQNTLSVSKNSSRKASFINNVTAYKAEETKKSNFTSFGHIRKTKGVLNLKKESYEIKKLTTKVSDNYLMNDITNCSDSKLVSTSSYNIDKLLTFFLTSSNDNQRNNSKLSNKYEKYSYNDLKKSQVKKNKALTLINNKMNINKERSSEKYNSNQNHKNLKSKSPLDRLCLRKKELETNNKQKNTNKKRKSVLIPELEYNSQMSQSINKLYSDKNKEDYKNISSNYVYNSNNNSRQHFNILSHSIEAKKQNSYKFMKINRRITKSNNIK